MEHARQQFAGDLIHIGNHQQQTLRRGERRRQGTALQRTVYGACGTGFGLHLDNFCLLYTSYCTNDKGQGPAWANSLFEDNAEFGLGMHLGVEKLRDRIQNTMEQAIANCTKCSDELKRCV